MTIKTLFRTFGQNCDVEIYKYSDLEDVTCTTASNIRIYKDPLFYVDIDTWYYKNGKIYIFI